MLGKMKKIDIFKMLLTLVALFLIFGIIFYFYGTLKKTKEPTNVSKVENNIPEYGYYINDNASSYYKEEFSKLKELLVNEAVDDEAYINQIAKLFTIDLLSLNNKINKYEVTSSQYYYSSKQDMLTNKVVDNFYDIIEDNSYNDRKQTLPEVTNAEITEDTKTTYKLGENEVDAYDVDVTVTYLTDLGYDKSVTITIVKENNKFVVVAYNPTKDTKSTNKAL